MLALLIILLVAYSAPLYAQERGPAALPPGEGRDLVNANCTPCHNLRFALMKRDGREGWRRLVEDMVLRGARLTPEEADAVVAYLFQSLGPGSGPTASTTVSLPAGAGKELVEARCGGCHTLERVTALKRQKRDWDGLIANMVERGATITPAEVQTIASYLVAHFGQ